MLKIWGRTHSINVQKVMWTVGELGLEHERVDAGGEHGRLDTPAYGAMNPNRRVPTLQEGPFALWESNAIVRYQAAIAAAVASLKSIWERLDRHLEGRSFVAGDRFTMGDIPVGATYHRYFALGVERGPDGNLSAWYERLKRRAPYRAHVMLPLS